MFYAIQPATRNLTRKYPVELEVSAITLLAFELETSIIDGLSDPYRIWRNVFAAHGQLLTSDDWAAVAAGSLRCGTTMGAYAWELLGKRIGRPPDDPVTAEAVAATTNEITIQCARLQEGILQWLFEARRRGLRCLVFSARCPELVPATLTSLGLSSLADPVGLDELISGGARTGNAACQEEHPVIIVSGSPWVVEPFRAAAVPCLATANKFTSHLFVPSPDLALVQPRLMSLSGALDFLIDTRRGFPYPPAKPPKLNRLWGCMAGLAVGDSVGKVVDKRPVHLLDAQTEQLLVSLAADEEPPHYFRGRFTDETVLLLAALGAVEQSGWISRDVFETCLRRVNPNGGRQIYKLRTQRGQFTVARDGASNGCISRCIPIAYLLGPDSRGDLAFETYKLVSVTHRHPDAVMAAAAYTLVLSELLRGEDPRVAVEVPLAVETALVRLASGGGRVLDLLRIANTASEMYTSAADYLDYLEESPGMGLTAASSVVSAISLAAADFPIREAFPLLLRRHGRCDLDSTAAVYMSLSGARRPDEVPVSWVSRIEVNNSISFEAEANALEAARICRAPSRPHRSAPA